MIRACCTNCFDDNHLTQEAFPALSAVVGKCGFCGSSNVAVVTPRKLREYFEAFLEVYEESHGGNELLSWLKRDWHLFPDSVIDARDSRELLAEIFDDGDINRKRFKPIDNSDASATSEWDELREELKHTNRWFISNPIDPEWLTWVLELTAVQIPASTWYRARLQRGGSKFLPSEMKAPPRSLSTHGRANPAGIPYLYLGSERDTAIAELRPHTGDLATVARFRTDPLKIADLINPRDRITPFGLESSEMIRKLRRDLVLLDCLGAELTRPVLPHNIAFDYVPSQYVCEFIKSVGFDGVRYRSAVSAGTNLALFFPEQARLKNRVVHRVTEVNVVTTEYFS